MGKKYIAAVALLAVATWAEMAMAPMLLMSAGHMHSAAEVTYGASHHHVMPAGHPCCPEIGAKGETEDAALREVSSSLPCQDEHRCCFRQGPQSVPAPVSAGDRLSQELPAATTELAQNPDSERHIFSRLDPAPGPPPGLLGMVLRV